MGFLQPHDVFSDFGEDPLERLIRERLEYKYKHLRKAGIRVVSKIILEPPLWPQTVWT